MNFKLLALLIVTAVFVYGLVLKLISAQSSKRGIPDNVRDVYDEETYLKWRAYQAEKTRLGIFSSIASYLILVLMICLDLYAAFASLFPLDKYSQMIAVILLDSLSSLLLIPFEYIDSMIIEQKYGFNRMNLRTFIVDQIKSFCIGLVLTCGLVALFVLLHQALGDAIAIVFACLLLVIVLFVSFISPYLGRIYNKFTPLEDGELKEKLTALLTEHGFSVRKIEVMDASKRSTKSNAYFTGFGKTKTIVLYDTLIQQMTPDEICAVFAHELGHGLHKDTLKLQLISFVNMALIAVLVWLTVRYPDLYSFFGFDSLNYGFAFILVFSVELPLLTPLIGLLQNALSRRFEYKADAQAAHEGYADALISALKTLGRANFSDLNPSPVNVTLEYSHPTLSQRIDALTHLKEESSHEY